MSNEIEEIEENIDIFQEFQEILRNSSILSKEVIM